ncbi:DUF4394 domain-containing protein [Falsirhodobacter sp. 20TX0035]|uniref:DUF4394 domain-containing protein n=1 Tax=Falsirhodobacter sp. 20TX0035 TaxID=3022019 RepID=UPI00232B1F96|nr:DUF4394 domain-containing protein [Falsirhodobacter sp. 20TX0035]MDB6453710.1 DUF4394 domain-containing protein [Falsirhodobacter sp. 20TX0035]
MTAFRTAVSATLALAASAGIAAAYPVIGLVDGTTLIRFDSEAPSNITTMEVTGAGALVGIDYRPGNKTLVGVTADNTIVTLDPMTGAATTLSTMNTPLPMADTPVIVDFNPMADRLRLMTGTTNHRVNADTGEVTVDGSLAYDAAGMHAGEAPMIAAAAYTNAFGKPEATAMYDIDTTIGALIRQTSPNDGTLAAVGKLGVELGDTTPAFDIHTTEDGTNTAWLVAGGVIHTVDLETGAATVVGPLEGVDGDLTDIAALPAM